MINIVEQSGAPTLYVTSFIADDASDVTDLPGLNVAAPGSTCFVIDTGDVYMLKSTGDWVQI